MLGRQAGRQAQFLSIYAGSARIGRLCVPCTQPAPGVPFLALPGCSGASVYMPDFEDSNCPTWKNLIEGQVGAWGRQHRRQRGWQRGRPQGQQQCRLLRMNLCLEVCANACCQHSSSAQRQILRRAPRLLAGERHAGPVLARHPLQPLLRSPWLQINLYDAVRRTISLTGPGGKSYRLKEGKLAVMLIRPRG